MRKASTGVEQTRSVMALVDSNCTLSSMLVVVANRQSTQTTSRIFKHATHYRDVDMMSVQSVPCPGHVSQRPADVDAAEHRLADLSDMP